MLTPVLPGAAALLGCWGLRAAAHHAILRGLRAPRLPHGQGPADWAVPQQEVHSLRIPGRGGRGLFGWLVWPGEADAGPVPAVLVMHGWNDPMATPDQVLALATELTEAGADWQIHAYGNTLHAFTNPEANDPTLGTVYSGDADRRSWNSLQLFLAEIF